MSRTETTVSNLKINTGTYANIETNISSIGENELIITDDKNIPIPSASDNGKIVSIESGDYALSGLKTINSQSIIGSGDITIQSAVWGNITGTLSNQTDLQTALNGKSTVSVSDSGTATDEVQYITINGVEKKLAGGGGIVNGIAYEEIV